MVGTGPGSSDLMTLGDSLVYEDAKEKCLAFLREGKDCAFFTIGDPSVFSTAGKFASMICGAGFGAKFLAGIPSFCQAAASASTVLCQAEEDLHIICGDEWFFDGRLTKELSSLDGGTKVIMKMNKSLIQILLRTVELGIEEKCLLVQNAVEKQALQWVFLSPAMAVRKTLLCIL